jgi:membrane protein
MVRGRVKGTIQISARLRAAADFARELAEKFTEHNSALMAAAVSFYVFLSLVPLLLLALAALGAVLQSKEYAYQTVVRFLHTYSPTIRPHLEEVIRGSNVAAGLGIIALLWAGSQAFVTLETVVNTAWGCRPRGFLKGRLVAIGLLLAVGVLLLVSFGITTAANAVQGCNVSVFGRSLSDLCGWGRGVLAWALPLAVTIATFTLIYRLLPNTHVPMTCALLGGVVAGILWEIAKDAFSFYATAFANYSAVYGSLAGIILLLVWIYYSSVVTILGAQISAVYQARHRPPGRA